MQDRHIGEVRVTRIEEQIGPGFPAKDFLKTPLRLLRSCRMGAGRSAKGTGCGEGRKKQNWC